MPPAQKDADGNIFIDRDPDSFAVILTFLRTGMLDQAHSVSKFLGLGLQGSKKTKLIALLYGAWRS